ncbi:hypothetical protein E2C01_041216 [Portunus trituberculatus]|uniref:Uncharacterized protein n=1 Tax=Portunus trituberculatus TaxID=210409 RepID=A0A5B7FRB8_PORTR|nr:hypothetical protein [Portunus trituberculatus]
MIALLGPSQARTTDDVRNFKICSIVKKTADARQEMSGTAITLTHWVSAVIVFLCYRLLTVSAAVLAADCHHNCPCYSLPLQLSSTAAPNLLSHSSSVIPTPDSI